MCGQTGGFAKEFRETCWKIVQQFSIFFGERNWLFRSEVQREILERTATSKAFIFWLEMLAQLFAVSQLPRT